MKKYLLLFLIFISFVCRAKGFGDEQLTRMEPLSTPFVPWFTGPLLAPSGATVAPGHANIEPYLFFFVNNGRYDGNWKEEPIENLYTTKLQIQTKVGVVKGVEFLIFPQFFYRETQGVHTANIADMQLGLGFQLLRSQVQNWWPNIKLTLRVNTPLGKYDHLNPAKLGTDIMGNGSWMPGPVLTFSKLYQVAEKHYLEARLAFGYQIGTCVHVQGYNFYGGTNDTSGKAYPGNIFNINGSIQYNFNQQWAFACDIQYNHTNKNRFSGFSGTPSDVDVVTMTRGSSEQFSLAPALEYGFSKNIGLIGGVWFSFAGRDVVRFVSGIIALNVYI